MLEWWCSLTHKQKIALIVAIIGAMGGIYITLNISSTGDTINPSTNGGTANVHTGTGDIHANVTNNTHIQNQTIHIGIALEQHEQRLKRRESEIRADLEQAHAADRQLLEIELRDIEQRLQDTEASYEAHIADLKERITQLEKLRGEFPDELLNQAIEALQQGETDQADRLFKQIEEEAEGHIIRAAEAAFQRGKIAQDAIRYADALKHYEKAVRLQPDNALYLNGTGVLHLTLANYQKAIEYFELSLASGLKTYGENHPQVATTRNNLGGAWRSLGENHKAIEYLELALASVLKTYGENHPHVAATRNNLGSAWDSLGEYHKAIEYYDLALATLEQSLGKDHPNTRTVQSNLDAARTALSASQPD
ncbi:tetratricopeptide repeat protein [Nitrosomonas sp.]|uniref:tetratricopeptide repeat protein n=1 Tax=Nitrosomonas sp. TaxID=42353 RepID=UPI00208976B9|nr:tetratricopeptide repeat protein [Nitrosomonas sp.]GJL74059.1 MAG: hypothetical protein NMNS02_01650 [Nitrosomonas sp.]